MAHDGFYLDDTGYIQNIQLKRKAKQIKKTETKYI